MTHYGIFFDPDGYMRLLRVDRLLETHDWYESAFPRSNAPFGETSHWSRPLDLLLIAGAGVGSLFTSFSHALEIWGWVFSLALLPVAAALLLWAYRPFLEGSSAEPEHWRDLLLITTLSSLDFLLPFYPGRPDHHSLLMLTALGQIGFALRLLGREPTLRDATGFGITAALGLWISVENLLVTGIACFVILGHWITHSEFSLTLLRRVMKIMTIVTLGAFLLERPFSNWAAVEYDKISIFHLAGIAGFWGLLILLTRFPRSSRSSKILSLFSGLALLTVLMTWRFPTWIHGPMAAVPTRAFSVWLNAIGEVMSIWDETPYSAARIIVLLGLGFCSLRATLTSGRDASPLVSVHQSRTSRRDVPTKNLSRIFILLGGLAFLFLGLLQRRWLSYAFLFLWIPLIPTMCAWVFASSATGIRMGLRKILIAGTPWVLLSIGGLLDEWKANAQQEPLPSRSSVATLHTALQEIAHWLENHLEERPPRIMAHLDYGPELMYYNRSLEVVATGYHRNAAGILDSYDFFHTTHPEEAEQMAQERKITHVLISRYQFEKEYFQVELPRRSLHTLLLKKEPPVWLEKIELPPELETEFTLYRVKTATFLQKLQTY